MDAPRVTPLLNLAGKQQTLVVCPFARIEGKTRLNSAVLLERDGHITLDEQAALKFERELLAFQMERQTRLLLKAQI